MRILVIDESPLHQASARQTLVGHDLTVISTCDEAYKALKYPETAFEISRPKPSFDAVLCDLLMPAGKTAMGPKGMEYVGQEMPVGFALSLMAVAYGVKYVAVATDIGHHDHPASAMITHITISNGRRFIVNGATVEYGGSPLTPVDETVCAKCENNHDKKEKCH